MKIFDDLTEISTPENAADLIKTSSTLPILIYKHSPICSVSLYSQKEFVDFLNVNNQPLNIQWVDVVHSRPASQKIAELIEIEHASPQILLISNGKCVWNASHSNITKESLLKYTADL